MLVESKSPLGILGHYLTYRIATLVMLGVLAVQLSLFTDLKAYDLPPREWLPALIGRGASVYWTTLLGATLYWSIVGRSDGQPLNLGRAATPVRPIRQGTALLARSGDA